MPNESNVNAPASRDCRLGHKGFVACVSLVAFLLQWLATSPKWLVHVNWDAASYLHQIAAGNLRWSSPTWTAHAGLQYLYLGACGLARLLGGTCADGFRLLAGVFFAASAAALAHTALALLRSRIFAALVAAFWATAFGTQFLTFTLEDNIVFIFPGVLLLCLFALRLNDWRVRDSFFAGLLAAAAVLLSLQGVLYACLPFFFALLVPRQARLPRRVLDGVAAAAGLVLGIAGFVVFFLAVSSLPWRQSLAHLAARPTSTFPQTGAALAAQVLDMRASLRTIGIATSLHVFQNRRPWDAPSFLVGTGALVLLVQVVIVAAAALWARRARLWDAFFFAVAFLGMTVLTSLYRDVEYAYLKRTDFVPLFVALLLVSFLKVASLSTRGQRLVAAMVGLVIFGQLGSGLVWRAHEAATHQTLDAAVLGRAVPGYHGVPAKGSFLRNFRDLRAANPGACAFVFDFPEVQHGRWNPDLTGSIWSELPRHYVLVAPAEMSRWPRRLEALDPGQAQSRLSGCEWLSEAAKKRLGR
ncbi:MAG: hypothetical protein JXP73_22105 [Deltaproteobacteria bacterium]|nr:hypothetical protein [Deltaproteobacteria bacterium]